MTAVSPLVFPGSRTLAGWWRQLAPLHPRQVWLGHLLLHRVEALAALQLPSQLDSFSLFVLRALALASAGSLPDLDRRLHLGLPLLRQLLRHLEAERLVRPEDGGTWSLTALGRQGLQECAYTRTRYERRAFYFVESEQPARPPHFLNLLRPAAPVSWPAAEGWRFEPRHLQACLGRPAEWKRRHGFPPEVRQIVDSGAAREPSSPPSQAWQRVVLDRPECLVAALVLVPAAETGERLVGFAVRPEGWALQAAEPAFVVEGDWHEAFPELAVDPSLDQWRHAWRGWCQPRGLPAAEVDACVLGRQAYRLRVTAGPRFVERLRAARSDVFKGAAWLLAGTGRFRAAARVELEGKREN